ncbi:hypothetical protein [Paenibacillus sedimenti]|uniref:Uncharacterized protein n=1 Tax=Paenibacillus sedimenti TaxID=2770274 RepID=A0A926QLX3_9BACL|nr:hypothetical protein [Paenibacillus sedimenti]MBD0384371.1 hypothetical protein [Paenibacillus sedimenti]
MKKNKLLLIGGIAFVALITLVPISVNAFQSFSISLPSEKQELLDREEALRKNAKKTPKIQNLQPKPVDLKAQIAENERSWMVGIIDDTEVPAGSHDVIIKNRWQGKLGDNYVQVYAGALMDTPEQGVLVLEIRNKYMATLSYEKINSASPGGSLKITGEDGNKLITSDELGTLMEFNVNLKSFD